MMPNDDETALTALSSSASNPLPGQDDPSRNNHNNNHNSHHYHRRELPEFFNLIKKSDWRKLRSLLHSPNGYYLCQQDDSTGLSCLAMAMVSQAPLDIVRTMIELDPGLPFRTDIYGATPLHLACLNGSSIEKMETLLGQSRLERTDDEEERLENVTAHEENAAIMEIENPANLHPENHTSDGVRTTMTSGGQALASIVDNDGRSALHHTIEFVCTNTFKKKTRRPASIFFRFGRGGRQQQTAQQTRDAQAQLNYCLQLVKIICKTAPAMVFSKCKHGLIPVDILQIHKVKVYKKNKTEKSEQYLFLDKLYSILRKTSIEEYKRRKLQWERERETIIRNDGDTNVAVQMEPGCEKNSFPLFLLPFPLTFFEYLSLS